MDFDKRTWRADVAAFAETAGEAGLSVTIERSRSGSGAHAWFFFNAPVEASAARQMGHHLCTGNIRAFDKSYHLMITYH